MSYRTQRRLKRLAVAVLILALTAVIAWLCWFLWLDRYVVYTKEGAVLRFDLPQSFGPGQQAQPVSPEEPVSIFYDDGNNFVDASTELTQLIGYYVDAAALEDIATVRTQLQALPAGTPVMVDVKSVYGNFYYSSGVSSKRSSTINSGAMDALITYLNSSGFYTIARLPALRDYDYGLNHVSDGLAVQSGGYLWADKDYCYWLNPDSAGTITHLVETALELRSLGFDEVVFSEFRFPDTDQIAYSADRTQALINAAQSLIAACTTDRFALSFEGPDADFALPEGRSRLYLSGVAAASVENTAEQTSVSDPAINLVFLTEVHDTRYDRYGVLRPLSAAH